MKKGIITAAALGIAMLTPLAAAAEETMDFRDMEETSFYSETGPFKDYVFIYKLSDAVSDFCRDNPEIDMRTFGAELDLEEPSNSKLDLIAGDEKTVELISEFIETQGYTRDILKYTVDPDWWAVPDVALIGDLNSDGKIDVTDLSELSLVLVGDKEMNSDMKTAADIDFNGKVELADLARLKQYLSKVVNSLF